MGESLNFTLLERLSRAVRPDFARTVLARRAAAGFLVLLAAIAAWHPSPEAGQRDVVVTQRDIGPGTALGIADVTLSRRPTGLVPDGAFTDIDAAIGATLTGPARSGEVLTDARVLGSRLAALSVGRDARTVPLHLAEAAVLDLIRPGDVVDVVGAPADGGDSRPRLVARDAVVVVISPAGAERVVLLALPAAAANELAAASLVQTLTLTIH